MYTCPKEPSDAAWERAGDVAAQILTNLAERDARARCLLAGSDDAPDAARRATSSTTASTRQR